MSQEKPLTVAIVPHAPYSLARGGMEVQQDQTIAALERAGVRTIRFNQWQESLEADIVHVFGCEYGHTEIVERASDNGYRVVVTPMFMPQRPLWQFGLARLLGSFLPPTAQSLRQRAVQGADAVVAINEVEKRELGTALGVDPNSVTVIPNGIEQRFYAATASLFTEKYGIKDFVLCVGSVEPRKNQIALLHAVSRLNIPMVFIGPLATRTDAAMEDYAEEFTQLVREHDNTYWIDGLSHNDPLLESAFAAAKVHALVSHAEAQGLVTMEAYAAGCRVVVSDLPHLKVLFGEDVRYANPKSIESIQHEVQAALQEPSPNVSNDNRPSWLLTWDDVARRLIDVYAQL